MAYDHPPSRSCEGLGDPSGPQTRNDKCNGFLKDADMYVRLLRLFSLKKFSSSHREKTLSEVTSDMERLFLFMRKICEME